MFLADFPWRYLGYFRKVVSGRAAAPELVPLSHNGATVRRCKTWIGEVVDDPALSEYITADSAPASERASEGGASTLLLGDHVSSRRAAGLGPTPNAVLPTLHNLGGQPHRPMAYSKALGALRFFMRQGEFASTCVPA